VLVPLAGLLRFRDPDRIGFCRVDVGRFFRTAVAAALAYGVLLVLVEPWEGVYDPLLALALEGPNPSSPGWSASTARSDGSVSRPSADS